VSLCRCVVCQCHCVLCAIVCQCVSVSSCAMCCARCLPPPAKWLLLNLAQSQGTHPVQLLSAEPGHAEEFGRRLAISLCLAWRGWECHGLLAYLADLDVPLWDKAWRGFERDARRGGAYWISRDDLCSSLVACRALCSARCRLWGPLPHACCCISLNCDTCAILTPCFFLLGRAEVSGRDKSRWGSCLNRKSHPM